MAYKELIDKKIGEVYQAGIATKILQHMDRIRNVSDTSQARRWVMELFQNSRDVAYKEQAVKIRIVLEDDCLSFYHNGQPFRVKDILSIVNQVSSKSPDESTIGQFGTGFMTTYQLSEVVEINAVLKEEGLPYKPFSIQIDRQGVKKEEILAGIFQTMEKLKKADDAEELVNYDKNNYNTQFKYHLNNEESYRIAKTGMEDLKDTILYVLLFSEKIEQVELIYRTTERRDSVLYVRAENSPVTSNLQKLCLIEKSGNTAEEKVHNLIYLYQDGMTLAAEMDKEQYFMPLPEYTPRLFVDFPLIGAEKFPFPIVINHREFKTNEPRSGITLVDNIASRDALVNKELMKQAVNLYQKFLHDSVEAGYLGLESIVEIPTWSPNKEWSETWVKANIYRSLYDIITQENMIETSGGKRALAYQDVFLIEGEGIEKEGVKQLAKVLYMHHVPIGTERWYQALQGYEVPQEKILSLSKMVLHAEDYLKNKLDETKMSAIVWCQNVYRVCRQNPSLAIEIKAGNIPIFPNQDEEDWEKRRLYSSIELKQDPQIREVLKKVSDVLDKLNDRMSEPLVIRKKLLHQDFKEDTPELEIYEKIKLENHIINRSSRRFPVTNFGFYQGMYEDAWKQAWYLMISCCPDKEMYDICKKILDEKLTEWKPLEAGYEKILWKNTYVNLLTMFLEEMNQYTEIKQFQNKRFLNEKIEDVYQWMNEFYKKLREYQMDSELRSKSVLPNQEGKFCNLICLYKDASNGEELKEIAREFSKKNEACNVYQYLLDKNIRLEDIFMSEMKDDDIARRIHNTVLLLLSEVSLPDAELVYQEACTRLLGWIQEHLEEAKKYFPDFWKEEDQMRLLTPKAAVGIQKEARKLKQIFEELEVENIEEAKEKLAKMKKLLLQEAKVEMTEEEGNSGGANRIFFNGNWDVYFGNDLYMLPMEEREDVLRQIGIAGERYAFLQFKEYFIKKNYSLMEEDNHKIKLESEDKKTSVILEYPDTALYHQAGWDIMLQMIREETEKIYYAEVKTHTEQSIRRGILDLSNEQMKKAAGCSEYYLVLEVSYNWQQKQGTGMTYYQDPIRQIAEGKLWNVSGKYELTSS